MAAVTTRITHPRPRLTVVPDLPPAGPAPRLLPSDTAPRRSASAQTAIDLPRVSRRLVVGPQSQPGLSTSDRRMLAFVLLGAGYCLLRLLF